jgi:muramidase (phage lysozyme)
MNTPAAVIITAAAAAAAWAYLRSQDNAGQGDALAYDFGGDNAYLPDTPDNMPDQLPGFLDNITIQAASVTDNIAAAVGLGDQVDPGTAERNRHAFLDMIAYSEGTAGPNGYRTMFGGSLASSLADHPRQFFSFTDKAGRNLKTSAAGRYQFLSRTWDELAKALNLPDFGPASQDAAALELIRRRGALKDVDAGRISAAIAKCAPIWASMPGAGYAQPERKLNTLLASYSAAGGNLEA